LFACICHIGRGHLNLVNFSSRPQQYYY